MVGLSNESIPAAREAIADDAKIDAALKFAKTVVEKLGKVSDEDVARVKNAGFDDGAMNGIAETEIDFPKVELFAKSVAA